MTSLIRPKIDVEFDGSVDISQKNEDFREAKNRAFLLSHMKIIETIFFVVLSSHDKVDRIFCYVPAISTLYPLELSLSHFKSMSFFDSRSDKPVIEFSSDKPVISFEMFYQYHFVGTMFATLQYIVVLCCVLLHCRYNMSKVLVRCQIWSAMNQI